MRIAICDTDMNYVRNCKKMLDSLGEKYNVKLEINYYRTNERLLFDLETYPNQMDLIFLEIDFAEELDGIQAAHKLRDFGYINEIIFSSHAKDRMQDAFAVDATYFLIKEDTSDEKFEEVFLMAKSKIERKSEEVIVLSCASESRSIPLRDIKYFEFLKRLIMVHYADEQFEFYSTLGKLEGLLCTKGFVRNHKAFLVSLRAVENISGSDIILKDGTALPLSRGYAKDVKNAFTELTQLSL